MTNDTSPTGSDATRSHGAIGSAPGGDETAALIAMREVRSALQGVGRSMPQAARVSLSAVDQMIRAIETGSDQQVTAGVSLSLGLAIGMLLGGAPRLLILAALAPVAVMGMALLDRQGGRTGTSAPTP